MTEELLHGMTEEEAVEAGCTCYDEYTTTFCPLRLKEKQEEAEGEKTVAGFGQTEKIILTDDLLTGYGNFEGFIFICPECQVPSVLVSPDIPGVCLKCFRRFDVRSKTVTDRIRKMMI